jgi:hypothetical protein
MFQLKRNWIMWHLVAIKAQELFVPVGCLKLGVKFLGSLSNKASEPPFKSRVVEQLFPLDWEAKSRYCRLSQELVASGLFILELVFFMVGAWLTVNGKVSNWHDKLMF